MALHTDRQGSGPQDLGRTFAEFRSEGLLWLVNASVFHPRGYALAFHRGNMTNARVTGWSLLGDGSEPWTYSQDLKMDEAVNKCFRDASFLLRPEVPK